MLLEGGGEQSFNCPAALAKNVSSANGDWSFSHKVMSDSL